MTSHATRLRRQAELDANVPRESWWVCPAEQFAAKASARFPTPVISSTGNAVKRITSEDVRRHELKRVQVPYYRRYARRNNAQKAS